MSLYNAHNSKFNNSKKNKELKMIVVQVKEGENIERALRRFKRKYERTGIDRKSVV